MRREYRNGLVRALRWAANFSSDSDELLDAADEIERLRGLLIQVLVVEGRCPTRLLIEISKALDRKEAKP